MVLLIFENIGTPELMLIGIVALIFLGPRRLPEIARKAGKLMSDLRSTTNDFKETWQREVNLEDEIKAFRVEDIEKEVVAREKAKDTLLSPVEPDVKEIEVTPSEQRSLEAGDPLTASSTQVNPTDTNDKRNWL